MREQVFQQIAQQLRSNDVEAVKNAYLEEAARHRMPPDLLHSCAELDLTELQKSTARIVRLLMRRSSYETAKVLYFQINPQKNWSVSAGLVPENAAKQQKALYWAQTDILEGRGSDSAARIYYGSLNSPWEDTAMAYLVYCTLWSLTQLVQKGQLPMQVLAGLSREDVVLCLQKSDIQQQNNINGGDTK